MGSTAREAEAIRRKLTHTEYVVLRYLVQSGPMTLDDLNTWLYGGDLNRNGRWKNKTAASKPYVDSLVRKGYAVRYSPNMVRATDAGYDRINADAGGIPSGGH